MTHLKQSETIRELLPEEIESVSGGGDVLQSASSAMIDYYGTGFSGSTSLENTYLDHMKPATALHSTSTARMRLAAARCREALRQGRPGCVLERKHLEPLIVFLGPRIVKSVLSQICNSLNSARRRISSKLCSRTSLPFR